MNITRVSHWGSWDGETVDLRLWGCENGGGGRQGHRDGRGHGGRRLFVFSQRDFLQEMVSASP